MADTKAPGEHLATFVIGVTKWEFCSVINVGDANNIQTWKQRKSIAANVHNRTAAYSWQN